MRKLLVLLVLCIASASCVELENLCSSDHFKYDGVLVNAFYKSRSSIVFPSLNHYLINSSITCDPSEFKNKTNFFEVLRIKNDFNRKFAKIYTNELNDDTAEELQDKRYSLMADWEPLYRMTRVEWSKCVQTFERMISSAYQVIQTLEFIKKDNSYPIFREAGYKPSNLEAIQILRELFEKFSAGGDGRTFALKNEGASTVYYRKSLVLPKEFKFLTDGSVQPDTESSLTFNQYLPFNSNRHTDEGCVPVEKLPLFYKNKGKK